MVVYLTCILHPWHDKTDKVSIKSFGNHEKCNYRSMPDEELTVTH